MLLAALAVVYGGSLVFVAWLVGMGIRAEKQRAASRERSPGAPPDIDDTHYWSSVPNQRL